MQTQAVNISNTRRKFGSLVLAIGLGGTAGVFAVFVATRTSPLLALGAASGLMLFVIMARWPLVGLYTCALVIPLERLGRFTDDSSMYTISLMRVAGVLALGALLLNMLVRRRRFQLGGAFALYCGYAAMAFLTVFYTTDFQGSVRACSAIIGNLMFFFLIINLVNSRRVAEVTVVLWLCVTVAIGLYTTYDWHFGAMMDGTRIGEFDPGKGEQSAENRMSTVWEDRSEWDELAGAARAMGSASHSAVYGINLVLTLPFFFYFFRREKRLVFKAALLLGLGVVGYNIMLTNTRAAILLAVLVVGIALFWRLVELDVPRVFLGAAGLIAILAMVPEDVWQRVLDLSNYTIDRSATLRIRLAYWDAAFRAFQDHWIAGMGVGNQEAVPSYLNQPGPDQTTAHCEYLQTAVEVGVVGWVLFFGFVSLVLATAFRSGKRYSQDPARGGDFWFMRACQLAMIAVLIYSIQVDVFHFPLKGWWLVAGLVVALDRLSGSVLGQNRTSTDAGVELGGNQNRGISPVVAVGPGDLPSRNRAGGFTGGQPK